MKLPWRRRGERTQVGAGQAPITLRRHARLEPVEPDDVLVSVGVGPNDEAIALWSRPADRDALRSATVNPGGATFPNARSADPVSARITVHSPGPARVAHVRDLTVAHPAVQPLPGGQTLVVGVRCAWRESGPDENALVLDPDGETIASATMGDGIAHVLATSSGNVWVGYFDEGVYGNYGWGGPGREPIGAPGLLRWTPDLEIAWRYPYDTAFGVIDDCYALNVDGETAWACYYSDFPIVCVDGSEISGWLNDVGGAQALTVEGRHVALFGGYRDDRNRVVVGELTEGIFERTFIGRLVLDDAALPPARMVARGPHLHAFIDTDWYRIDVDDIQHAR